MPLKVVSVIYLLSSNHLNALRIEAGVIFNLSDTNFLVPNTPPLNFSALIRI